MALNQKVSWISLKTFLKELISSFDSSKQLNEVLLEELQLLHSHQSESKTIEKETEEQEHELFSEQESKNKKETATNDNADKNLDQLVTDKDCSNEIVENELYETLFDEDNENITNDNFTIQYQENDSDFQNYEEADLTNVDQTCEIDDGTLCNTTVDRFEIDHDIESNFNQEDGNEELIELEETSTQIQSDDQEGDIETEIIQQEKVSIVDDTKSNPENIALCNTKDDQIITEESKGQ